MDLFEKVSSDWRKFLDHGDPRTSKLFLMDSPFPVLFISLVYLVTVTV
jgi:hypothetical protein